MAMVINHNLSALNTYNQLNKNTNLMNSSLQKLSSGYQINTAADDAAGLTISEKMRGQIRGLDQASDNAQDGISMVQTAEGALDETTQILQRMRELAVQSSSDTNTDDDRDAIQSEIDQLTTEIDRISNTTEFNTKKLLNGSLSAANSTDTTNIQTNTALANGATTLATAGTSVLLSDLTDTAGNSLSIDAGDKITVSYMKNGSLYTASTIVTATTDLNDLTTLTTTNVTAGTSGGTVGFTFDIDTAGGLTATAASTGTTGAIYGLTITVADASADATGATTYTTNTDATDALSDFNQTAAAKNKATDGTATILIGANTGQDIQINIGDMGASALGVANLDVSTQEAAEIAISTIDTATKTVSSSRSYLGAVQNRLDHTINNLTTTSENLTSAESNIRDVDMASEMANYTKLSVITQAATAMLAQANQQPQQVLQLLQ